MAFIPKRIKFRKAQKGKRRGISSGGSRVTFGEYGLQALCNGWITERQIEAARVAIMRHLQGGGKLWIRIFPDKPITKKPSETRMGKGKGAPSGWVAVVKRGRIMLELEGVPLDLAREALRLASHKVPLESRFVTRSVI